MNSYMPSGFRKSLFLATLIYITSTASGLYSQEKQIPDTSSRKYAKRYYEQYLNPETLSGMPKASWHENKGNKDNGTLYPIYNITSDWNTKGFSDSSICEVFREARKASRRPKKILERYNSGQETLILLHGGNLSPLEQEAMGEFSFYVQKTDSGTVLRVKDIYDPKRSGFGKIEKFIPKWMGRGKAEELFIQKAGNGSPYIMEGEWEIPESLIFNTFSDSSLKESSTPSAVKANP
ncbi:MAG: hypothetical protein JW716_04345 [Candidatus Aenigmarchaeota archaeon]|nr:hypothetical protein [Candidatus Aenigmarchaeota archaeon]